MEEIISSAVIKFAKRFPDVKIDVEMPQEFLMVPMDGILIEQVLVNLLENSVLHGKTTKLIRIVVIHEPGKLLVAVEDDGQELSRKCFRRCLKGRSILRRMEKNMMPSGIWALGCPCARALSRHIRAVVKAENMSAGRCRSDVLAAYGGGARQMEIKDRVLVIEDDKSIRNFMKTILEANNYEVIMAVRGGSLQHDYIPVSGCGDTGSGSSRYGRHEDFKECQRMVRYADPCGIR